MKKNNFYFGQSTPYEKLSLDTLQSLYEEAEKQRDIIAKFPIDKIWQVFSEIGKLWADPEYRLRKQAEELLPSITGFSAQMIRLGLDEIKSLFDPKYLNEKLTNELRHIPRQGSGKIEGDSRLKWAPLGSVLHILSGNVFLVGPGSFIEGVITGNVSFLKMSSEETFFMPLFMESVREAESNLGFSHAISDSVALLEYSSSETHLIEDLKQRMDAILVWGGEAAVNTYRSGLPARTRLIIFGPKLSFAFITKKSTQKHTLSEIAENITTDISIWDQNACTAPQLCFVESLELAEQLVEVLPEKLNNLNEKLPAGKIDMNTAAEIQKIRSIYEMADIRDEGKLKTSKKDLAWTVFLDKNVEISSSPLHRTLRIVPFENKNQIIEQLTQFRSYIQTIGLCCSKTEMMDLSEDFISRGVLRIMPLGNMNGGSVTDPHDGAYDLPQLLNLVVHRNDEPLHSDSTVLNDLNVVLKSAENSSYYKTQLPKFELSDLSELVTFPVLDREVFEDKMFPKSTEFQTVSNVEGGVVTKSGGSTGEPKFSWFSQSEWIKMKQHAASIFKDCGLSRTDRVANFFLSGNMYGSFASFFDVNNELGMTQFPFSGQFHAKEVLNIAKSFSINVFQGIPTTIMPLLRELKKLDDSFTLEKVVYAGQPLNNVDKKWLKENLDCKLICSIIGTTETNQVAYQCPHLDGDLHHLADDYNHFEIVNEENKPVAPGEAGRLLVTTLNKNSFPLIRYDIGDSVKESKTKCACGSSRKIIHYLGRHDQIICAALMNFDFKDFEKALSTIPYSCLQVVTKWQGEKELLQFNVEIENSSIYKTSDIQNLLCKNLKEFEDCLNKSTFICEIQLHEIGGLERDKRTGKVKNILDLR